MGLRMRAASVVLPVLLGALPLAGCGGCLAPVGPPDAGSPDGGFDAGSADAGFDAGSADAGFDAGPADAGFDAGSADAGFDAGFDDAGFDAGSDDAGFDAGSDDAGFDAGPLAPVCVEGDEAAEEEPAPDVLITTLSDVVDASDGVLSLREALRQLGDGTIPAGSVIGFDPSLAGSVELASVLSITRSVTLVGHDCNGDGEPDVWLERDSNSTLLLVDAAPPATVRLRLLGFTGSPYLLAIDAPGRTEADPLTVAVERCSFTNAPTQGGAAAIQVTGAVPNLGVVPVMHLSIRDTSFRDVASGVRAGSGAPLPRAFTASIESCTFENAAIGGPAIGLFDFTEVSVINTIISGPASGASVLMHTVEDARFVNTTIVSTSTSPRLSHQGSHVTLHNTVLSGPGADCGIATISIAEGHPVTAQHSVIGNAAGCTFVGDENLLGTAAYPIDPGLLPLANHGGARKSAPPAPGSVLIDKGSDALAVHRDGSPLDVDVRGVGYLRRHDGDTDGTATVDVGATELTPTE